MSTLIHCVDISGPAIRLPCLVLGVGETFFPLCKVSNSGSEAVDFPLLVIGEPDEFIVFEPANKQ